MSFDPNTEDFEKAYWWDEDNEGVHKQGHLDFLLGARNVDNYEKKIVYRKKPNHPCLDCKKPTDPKRKRCDDCREKIERERSNKQSNNYYQKNRNKILKRQRERLLKLTHK